MAKRVWIEDITIRDGAQCLWATRLSTEEIVPIARTMDRAGFQVTDLTGGAAIDTSIMFLREDPFERVRVLSALMPNSRLNFNTRGQSVFRWTQYPDDVAELTIRTFARNGIRSVMLFDPLNDMRNLEFTARVARENGLYTIGSVTYTISPYHTDSHFMEKTRELVEMGLDAISLKDPSGLLTPNERLACSGVCGRCCARGSFFSCTAIHPPATRLPTTLPRWRWATKVRTSTTVPRRRWPGAIPTLHISCWSRNCAPAASRSMSTSRPCGR